MMRLEAITLSVRRKDCVLVQAASLAATSGEFIGLVGPNGAGKTTLLRALAGLEAPAAGHVAIDGADMRAMSPRERARKLSYLPQAREVAWSITAEAVVALGRFAYGTPARLGPEDRAAADRAFASTDAGAFRTRTMSTLSGGEQARIHLARALAAEAPILLADEPTAALDPKHARAIMQALRAKADGGGIVFAALHDLRLARRWCSRIIVMNEGDLVADDDAERAMTPAIMETVFGAGLADL
ncbi:MAG: ABC transporter ATP-binding protein [Parvularculaceae bacterium]